MGAAEAIVVDIASHERYERDAQVVKPPERRSSSERPDERTQVLIDIENGCLPLLEPRVWQCRFSHWRTATMFKRAAKLTLYFTVAEPGDNFGDTMCAYFNMRALKGKECRFGGFIPANGSVFLRTYCALSGTRPKRLDRISLHPLRGKFFNCTVRPVTSTHEQEEVGEQYSVIERIIEEVRS